jgi:hypothetical protein
MGRIYNKTKLEVKPNKRYQCFWYASQNNEFSREEAVKKITELGYREVPACNGGDDDQLIIDTVNKQWIWWEGGFWPFHSIDDNSYPQDNNMLDWFHKHAD